IDPLTTRGGPLTPFRSSHPLEPPPAARGAGCRPAFVSWRSPGKNQPGRRVRRRRRASPAAARRSWSWSTTPPGPGPEAAVDLLGRKVVSFTEPAEGVRGIRADTDRPGVVRTPQIILGAGGTGTLSGAGRVANLRGDT